MEGQEPLQQEKHTRKAEEARQIARLREEQEKAIQQTKERLEILEKFKQDYIALKDRLVTLPDKLSHDVMVPFGKLAFMPGKLVHTNEILVLLGDNWFAEMSAKQASHTVDRRISVLDEQLTELRQQGDLLEPRLQFTSELQDMAEARGDLVEIKEEYDEEKERLWREEHHKKLQAYNRQRREEEQLSREASDKTRQKGRLTEAELWARLAELKRQEDEAGEMNTTSSESSEEENSGTGEARRIRWQDEGPKPRDRGKTIYFTHSKAATTSTPHREETGVRDLDSHSSPGDIYTHFRGQRQGPKSILKPSTTGSVTSTQTSGSGDTSTGGMGSKDEVDKQTGTASVEAFTGSVVEKPVTLEDKPESGSTEVTTTQPQRPVSKFKAQRMARK